VSAFFEDHHVDALAELRAQQCLAQRQPALHTGERGDQQGLQQYQSQHRVPAWMLECIAVTTASTMREPTPGNSGRPQAADQGQRRGYEQQRAIGVPDEAHRVPAVAEHAEKPRNASATRRCGAAGGGCGGPWEITPGPPPRARSGRCRGRRHRRRGRFIAQVRCQQRSICSAGKPLRRAIVLDLVAIDLADAEVARLGVRKIPAADRAAGCMA